MELALRMVCRPMFSWHSSVVVKSLRFLPSYCTSICPPKTFEMQNLIPWPPFFLKAFLADIKLLGFSLKTAISHSDQPEQDTADDSALLFGRTSCRSRRKIITGFCSWQEHRISCLDRTSYQKRSCLIELEVWLIIMWSYILHVCIFVKYLPICIRIELVLSLLPNLAKFNFQVY